MCGYRYHFHEEVPIFPFWIKIFVREEKRKKMGQLGVFHRIIGWLGLEGTAMNIRFSPLLWAALPATSSGCPGTWRKLMADSTAGTVEVLGWRPLS